MKLEIVSCQPRHIRAIEPQVAQAFVLPQARRPGAAEEVCAAGPCFAGLVGEAVIACLGILREAYFSHGHSVCWGYLSKDVGPYLLPITHHARRFLDQWPDPVEVISDRTFEASGRWHRLLGFELVGALIAASDRFLPDGGVMPTRDYDIYLRTPRRARPSILLQ